MMNKSTVLCIYFVTGLLLYDSMFDISWLFSPQVHYLVLFVMAALRAHVVLAVTSLTFPNLAKLPCSLYTIVMRKKHPTPLGHVMYMICSSVKIWMFQKW